MLDENGQQIKAITDKNGKYLFKDLPIIEENERYLVKIDSNQSVLAPYQPTKASRTTFDMDSSTNVAYTAIPLTEDLAQDLTLDFGFVLKDEKNNSGKNDNKKDKTPTKIASTGNGEISVLLSLLLLGFTSFVYREIKVKNN